MWGGDVANAVKSDIVMALAVTHHLILTQQYQINDIFNTLKSYSNKYVFVEFMPLGLWNGHNNPTVPDWYTVDWFKEHFEKYFKLLKIDHYEKNRILFIGEII